MAIAVPTRAAVRAWAEKHPRRAAAAAIALLVAVSTVVRFVLALGMPAPWIFVDELIYSELARSAFTDFAIRGVPVTGYGPVYPYAIAPAYAIFDDLVHAYAAVKAINAFVMSLTAVPVYLLAASLMRRRWAFASAGLSLLVPGMTYTGVVMTESAFYPLFALAIWLTYRALHRPTVVAQILVFAAATACFETRPQGAVVVPAFVGSAVLAVAADFVFGDGAERARCASRLLVRFIPTWLVAIAGVVGLLRYEQLTGRPLSTVLGAYSITLDSGTAYAPKAIASWGVLHIAETALWLGVLPMFAFLLMCGCVWTRSASREARMFVIATVPVVLAMTVIVSAFLIFSNVGRIEERNLFYVGPVFLVAFGWWLDRPRAEGIGRWGVVAIVGACGLPLLIPYERFLNQSAVSDTFGLFFPWAVQLRLGDATLTTAVVFVGVAAAAAVAVAVRPRSAIAVLAVLVAFFVLSDTAVQRRTDRASADTRAGSIGEPRDWVDATGLAPDQVTAVYPGGTDPLRLWQAEFFNRAVGSVLTIGAPLAGALPETVVNINPDGSVVDRSGHPVSATHALADSYSPVIGSVIARDNVHRMQVVEVDPPLRVAQLVTGIFSDGWSSGSIGFTRYACSGGALSVDVESDLRLRVGPVDVVPKVGDVVLAPVSVPPDGKPVRIVVPLRAADGVCSTQLDIPGTVVPQTVSGEPDTRSLGVRVVALNYQP